MAMSVNEVVARVRSVIRDASGNTFDDAVLQESVREGLREAFPRIYTIEYDLLGTFGPGTAEVTGLLIPERAIVHAVEYKAGVDWLALPGMRRVGPDTVSFRGLTQTRQLRLLLLVPVDMPTTMDEDIPLSDDILDAVQSLAIAWVFDGYLAGRVPYDKWTTSTSDDAIAPFEVQSVARHHRERADVRLRELGMPKPIVRVR